MVSHQSKLKEMELHETLDQQGMNIRNYFFLDQRNLLLFFKDKFQFKKIIFRE